VATLDESAAVRRLHDRLGFGPRPGDLAAGFAATATALLNPAEARAAERLVLGEVSTGAANDLAGATQLAIRMVREFGMSPRLGPIGFSSEDPAYLGDQPISNRQYAEATQRVIDEEVERLLKEANERATKLLTEHREALDRLTELLLQKETVSGDEVLAVAAGPAPAAPVDPADAPISHKASGIRPGEPA